MKKAYWMIAAVCLFTGASALCQGKPAACPDRLSATELDHEIDALIERMTPAERIAQMGDRAPAIPRLGILAYNWWNEGLHGVARNGYATVFPQSIGLAATWDGPLLEEIGDTVSTEARAKFNGHADSDSARYAGLTFWSPNINIFRDPRWGRGQETFGEDPFLTGTLGTQFVRGVQGGDAFYKKADATPKHFDVHSGPERGRDSFNSVVSAHDLADTYLPAFHAVLTQGHAEAMMCSYNAINGVPACANVSLLKDRVRGRWGFGGYIVSDCDAVGNLHSFQHYSADAAHGAAAALQAGVDLDCGSSYRALNRSLAEGLVQQSEIDSALHRLLLAKIRLGLLGDNACSPYHTIRENELDTPARRALAQRAAAESLVLLHNDGVLPLAPETTCVAVIGPEADSLSVLEANYHGTAVAPVTPLAGMRRRFAKVTYAQGSLLADGIPAPLPETALRVSDGPGAAAGLHAEYFDMASFDNAPAAMATARTVDLDLDRVGPSPAISSARYAARWTGFFAPPATGDYTLMVHIERCWDCKAHDSFRLLLDGKVVLDDQTKPDRFVLHAQDRRLHPLTLELMHSGEDEGITLEWLPPAEVLLNEAVAVASASDAVLAFVGLGQQLEGEALRIRMDGFDGGDRTSLALPATQRELLQRLRATGKPIIVVVTAGSAVALPATGLNALLEAWYPGQAGGEAIAAALAGDVSPAGRLPVTIYRSASDLPAFTDYSMANRTYRYFNGPVLFPFGSGRSYTQFGYSRLKLSKRRVKAGEDLTVNVSVRNLGTRGSDEVVELYVLPPAMPGAPRLALQGFERVHLQPGELRKIASPLKASQLSFVDLQGHRSERPGEYTIYVGGGQPGTGSPGLRARLRISGMKEMEF